MWDSVLNNLCTHRNSLVLANEKGMKSVAFPAISCGVYGYPLHEAAKVLHCLYGMWHGLAHPHEDLTPPRHATDLHCQSRTILSTPHLHAVDFMH